MADQAIFTLMDFSIGVAADKVSRTLGRLGRLLVVLTAISCLAFMLLPLAAPSTVVPTGLVVLGAYVSGVILEEPTLSDIAEVIIYNRQLAPDEFSTTQFYLLQRFLSP